jgi:hypothetical protein
MSTPKGMKCTPRTLATGDKIHIYSDADHIVLQMRHQVPTEEQLLESSFKVAVALSPGEAIAVASDLLNAALPQLAVLRADAEEGAAPDA